MTPQEFKAWFDGFTEAFSEKVPTQKQWARIKERVGEIDGRPVTERVFVDRYWPTYIPYPSYPLRWYGYGVATAMGSAQGGLNQSAFNVQNAAGNNLSALQGSQGSAYNSLSAMGALGRADAEALS